MTITETQGGRADASYQDQEREDGRKVVRMFLLFAIAIGIMLLSRWYETAPPEPNYSGYYSGDWVNKRGQLVSPDGRILNENYGRQKTASPPSSGYAEFEVSGP